MKKLFIALPLLMLSPLSAQEDTATEEVQVEVVKKEVVSKDGIVSTNIKPKAPSNKPVPFTKVSPKLDFGAFKAKLKGAPHLGVRIRNGKHKQGSANITITIDNATLIVQRIDLFKSMEKILAEGDGEHVLDTFLSSGKPYEILYKVEGGKLSPQVSIKSK